MRLGSAIVFSILMFVFGTEATTLQDTLPQAASPATKAANFAGRWRVKFVFAGRVEMNLILHSQPKGVGSFLLLDTAADGKPEPAAVPAAWSQASNDRVNFSGEVELPIGTCCREVGTLIFKGRSSSSNSISGKLIFVASTEEDENPLGFRSLVGTFTATRVLN